MCAVVFCSGSSAFGHPGFHEEIDLINTRLKQEPDSKELLRSDAVESIVKLILKFSRSI